MSKKIVELDNPLIHGGLGSSAEGFSPDLSHRNGDRLSIQEIATSLSSGD